MIIFKDKITDDEMISDSYDLKEIDGIAYEADCAMIEEGVGDIGKSVLGLDGRPHQSGGRKKTVANQIHVFE